MLRSIIRNAGQFMGEAEHKFKIDSGNVIWGHEVTVAISRKTSATPSTNRKASTRSIGSGSSSPGAARGNSRALGQMLFSGEDALKPTSGLRAANARGSSSAS